MKNQENPDLGSNSNFYHITNNELDALAVAMGISFQK